MKAKKRIGLFGGSFNPIHNFHIWMINYLLDKKIVDEVWIVPCKKHNFDKSLIDAKYRLEMIKLAIKNVSKKARISYVELKMGGKAALSRQSANWKSKINTLGRNFFL